MSNYTTIRIKKETHQLLLTQGTVKDSLDSVIRNLIIEKQNQNFANTASRQKDEVERFKMEAVTK